MKTLLKLAALLVVALVIAAIRYGPATLAIAKKELKTYFNSPIAYVFTLIFAGAALASFFQAIWVVDQATLRPLFDVLPLLLLVLVPALTMRLWSEEQKLGTLEVLLTMPIRDVEIVAGKFLAALALLVIALALTIGAPITMAMYGPLDRGPAIGGYAAAMFLGAAYLAIGLFISSLTENQILAFLGALLVSFALWAIGEPFLLNVLPGGWGEALEPFGTGARFRSVARGVLDVRDLFYYASIVGFALVGNTFALKMQREG